MQRMGNRVSQRLRDEKSMQVEDITAQRLDLPVLRLSKPPNQKMDFAVIVRKICGHFFPENYPGQVRDF
jgi:hypothetical protein